MNSGSGLDAGFRFEVRETAAYLSGRRQLNAYDERGGLVGGYQSSFPRRQESLC